MFFAGGGPTPRCFMDMTWPEGRPIYSRARLFPLLLATFLALPPVLATTTSRTDAAEAESAWSYDVVSGIPRFSTHTNDGASFTIWCQKARKGMHPVVDVRIDNRPPPAGKLLKLIISGSIIQMRADRYGLVRADCRYCGDQFTWLWHMLRRSSGVQVLFDDERFANFSLRGVSQVLGARICGADAHVARSH
jgi:hypothetical protein